MTPSTKSYARASGNHAPYAWLGLVAVATGFGGFGIWAAKAPLASAAIAPAQVTLETNRKPIQHLEGGIVSEILVKETEKVKEGQVLFRLEPVQARANMDLLSKQLDAATALETRLAAQIAGKSELVFPDALLARRSVAETAAAITDQASQFEERRRLLAGEIGVLEARVQQTTRDAEGKLSVETSLKSQLASYNTEIGRVSDLAAKGFYPKNKLLALERERTRIEGDLGTTTSAIARCNEMIAESRMQIQLTTQRYKEEASRQLADVRNRLSDLGERLAVAQDVFKRVDVRAPRDGIVQGVKVFAPGAVVRPGDTLAELIPTSDKLVMTARVSPLDIDSVRPGQEGEVRFSAFSTRTTATILGRVERVAADSMWDETARELYYPARVIVDLATLPTELAERLVPGMPADVLLTTGERTVLQYLVGPLTNSLTKTMREE